MKMSARVLALGLLVSSATARAADPVDEVRRAETSFAKAFADRDAAAFFAHVLDDASFLAPNRTLGGKEKVKEVWSRFFKGPEAPFSWGPERVVVNGAGTIGLSTGPVYDAKGNHVGNFSSIWVRQPDGSWKVLFDGPGSPAACLPGDEAKEEQGFVTAEDGAKLHFHRIGSAPTVLIVPLEYAVFDDFKQLADAATVIAYDPRNRGRSSKVDDVGKLTIQEDVKDLEAVRKHFGVEKFVPVGYSYLGLMVSMYAMEHPEHVSRLVQLGPVPMRFDPKNPAYAPHGREDAAIPDAAGKKWQELMANREKGDADPKAACATQLEVFRYLLVGNPAHAPRIRSWCDLEREWPSNSFAHLTHHFASVQKVSLAKADLAKLTMPVLTIHGTKDRNAAYGGGKEWAASLPDARLVTVDGAAHASWVDDPVIVFGSIRHFLRGDWPLTAEKVGAAR